MIGDTVRRGRFFERPGGQRPMLAERSRYDGPKRLIDVVASTALLVVLAPVSAATAVAVYLDLGRPVIFSQRRPGLGGQPFTLFKFRTMRSGTGPDQERLTSVGRLIRSVSLDEVPQLVNVLRGEMSLVGPRPLLEEYLDLYSEHHARRHHVRPGITGLAQVEGRNAIDWGSRLDLDVEYVERRSFALDVRILCLTILRVVSRSGVMASDDLIMTKFDGKIEERPKSAATHRR